MTYNSQEEKDWPKQWALGLNKWEQIQAAGYPVDATSKDALQIKKNFDIRVPSIFLEAAKSNQALARQFIPSRQELVFYPEELDDPIGDETHTPVEGITHRYPDRVLLKLTYTCGVYCRFCFRRHKVSKTKNNPSLKQQILALDYIKQHREIWEVILTGGDPLVLTNDNLKNTLNGLSQIEHVKVIRFHTRVITALPQRITKELVDILKSLGKSVWIAVHANSHWEFTPKAKDAIDLLLKNGIPLVLQSVLLKGVNDGRDELVDLLKTAVSLGIKPYYLHYPDLAKGTEHFRIPLKEAINLVKSLRGSISGLCIPQLMVDIPNGKGKIAINTHQALQLEENTWQFESPLDGELVRVVYPEQHIKLL